MIDVYEDAIMKLIILSNEYVLIKMHGYKKRNRVRKT